MSGVERAGDAIRHHCDLARVSTRGTVTIAGWALTPCGIVRIDVMLDGELIGNAEIGRRRRDVAKHFPHARGAEKSGFRFERALKKEVAPNAHEILVRFVAGDGVQKDVRLNVIAEHEAKPAVAPGSLRIELDSPRLAADSTVLAPHGALVMSGWAVSRAGIAAVEVFCGDKSLGAAHLGTRREDIAPLFPDYPGSLVAGYGLVIAPDDLAAGEHRFRIVARDHDEQTAARAFVLRVDANAEIPPGMRRVSRVAARDAETAARLLRCHNDWPGFRVVILAPDGLPKTLLAVRTTLESLILQSYDRWSASVIFPDQPSLAMAQAQSSPLGECSRSVPERQLQYSTGTLAPPAQGTRQLLMRLRAGDILGANGLQEFALAAAAHRDASFIYADDLRPDGNHRRPAPYVKPVFSRTLLLSTNYIGRAWCAGESALADAPVAIEALSEIGDWDLVLRLSGQGGGRVVNIAHVLMEHGHLRDSESENSAAVSGAIARLGWRASVQSNNFPGVMRIKREVPAAKISVIMPSCGARDLVRVAIASIRATQDRHAVEIVIADNMPDAPSALRNWVTHHADVMVPAPGGFNWSAFNNAGARAASGEFLLFLNDDIEAVEPGWLDSLLEFAGDPAVGVVGARLLYPDGKIQHAGQYLAGAHARHAFRFGNDDSPGPFGLAHAAREVISVTGACMMMRREVFDALGGFDEAHPVVNNDLDFCLRVWAAGLAVIYTPHAKLIHHELASRLQIADDYDGARFEAAHAAVFAHGDPWRSPALVADSDHYLVDEGYLYHQQVLYQRP